MKIHDFKFYLPGSQAADYPLVYTGSYLKYLISVHVGQTVQLQMSIRDIPNSTVGWVKEYPNFRDFTQCLQPNIRRILLGHDRLLPYPFQFIIQQQSNKSTFYSYLLKPP
jgi:hypothetical protein